MADYGATERVRTFVAQHFFEPARTRKQHEVTIHAGSLSKLLEERNLLKPNRYPVICGAMTNSQFAERNGARLVKREGPQSGQSSSATFTFVLDSVASTSAKKKEDGNSDKGPSVGQDLFLSLYGILKEAYAEVGGAQAFHEAEREDWDR